MELVGDVAGGEDAGGARLQPIVDEDAVVDGEPRRGGEHGAGRGADADHDGVAVDRSPVLRADPLHAVGALERRDGRAEQHLDPVVDVDVAVDRAHLGPEHPLERDRVRRDHGHLDAPLAGGSGDLAADPAGADDHQPAAGVQAGPQCVAVVERAQVVDAIELAAGDAQPPRRRARGQEQAVVAEPLVALRA